MSSSLALVDLFIVGAVFLGGTFKAEKRIKLLQNEEVRRTKKRSESKKPPIPHLHRFQILYERLLCQYEGVI